MNEVPLFLLDAVLFPGGRIRLRVFETRYLDMVRACLREEKPFGVCLIASGREVLAPGAAPAIPHEIGTLAFIVDWEVGDGGLLGIVAEGRERFRIRRRHTAASGLVSAEIALLPQPPIEPVPQSCARLVPLLRELVENLEAPPPKPHRFYDAGWVADRYAELLPLPTDLAQRLLETESGGERLLAIRRFLEEL